MGDVGIRAFKKLISSHSGAEISGCFWNLEALEQIQLKALHTFFGIETLYPRMSLLLQMGDLPMVWLARLRCTVFWFRMFLSKVYMMRGYWEAWQWRHGKGSWMKNLKIINCCRDHWLAESGC